MSTSAFYSFLSTVAFARELLDPGGSMDEFERQWTSIEQIYLESTFDVVGLLFVYCLLMGIVYCFVMFLCPLTMCHVVLTISFGCLLTAHVCVLRFKNKFTLIRVVTNLLLSCVNKIKVCTTYRL